jgi:mono/diheme cytochrome c family protein
MRVIGWCTILILAAAAAAPAADKPEKKDEPVTGERVYRQKCGGCHGLDGKSEPTMAKDWGMRDLVSPEVQKQSDTELNRAIANGRGHMPAYEMILGQDKIREVVAYIRELPKK